MDIGDAPPVAGYIYTLSVGGLGLAWEYLRRNQSYRESWRRRRSRAAARSWGLRSLEDPNLDARAADPTWQPAPLHRLRLVHDRDDETPARFSLWTLPGLRQLFHDGRTLRAMCRADQLGLRLELGDDLADGGALTYGVTAQTATASADILRFERELVRGDRPFTARPDRAAVAHMHGLLALDAERAGLSHRQIGGLFFGAEIVAARWDEDSAIRATVRDALKRGRRYRDGHWRSLVWPR